jgi:transposase
MFALSPATRIYLAAGATDLRQGFNGLTSRAQTIWAADPLSGHLFLFTNKHRNRLKILWWDGSGLWLCTKRLEKGRFSWPEASVEGSQGLTLDAQELALLVGGIDLTQTRRKEWWRKPPLEG